MLQKDMSVATVAEACGLTQEKVLALKQDTK